MNRNWKVNLFKVTTTIRALGYVQYIALPNSTLKDIWNAIGEPDITAYDPMASDASTIFNDESHFESPPPFDRLSSFQFFNRHGYLVEVRELYPDKDLGSNVTDRILGGPTLTTKAGFRAHFEERLIMKLSDYENGMLIHCARSVPTYVNEKAHKSRFNTLLELQDKGLVKIGANKRFPKRFSITERGLEYFKDLSVSHRHTLIYAIALWVSAMEYVGFVKWLNTRADTDVTFKEVDAMRLGKSGQFRRRAGDD